MVGHGKIVPKPNNRYDALLWQMQDVLEIK